MYRRNFIFYIYFYIIMYTIMLILIMSYLYLNLINIYNIDTYIKK